MNPELLNVKTAVSVAVLHHPNAVLKVMWKGQSGNRCHYRATILVSFRYQIDTSQLATGWQCILHNCSVGNSQLPFECQKQLFIYSLVIFLKAKTIKQCLTSHTTLNIFCWQLQLRCICRVISSNKNRCQPVPNNPSALPVLKQSNLLLSLLFSIYRWLTCKRILWRLVRSLDGSRLMKPNLFKCIQTASLFKSNPSTGGVAAWIRCCLHEVVCWRWHMKPVLPPNLNAACKSTLWQIWIWNYANAAYHVKLKNKLFLWIWCERKCIKSNAPKSFHHKTMVCVWNRNLIVLRVCQKHLQVVPERVNISSVELESCKLS